MRIRELLQVAGVPAVIASLCCLSPIILFSLGVVSLSVASELADVFYGEYMWVFRGAGIIALIIFVVFYLRKQKVCTFDDAVRRRNEVVNIVLFTFFAGVLLYIVFLYGVVEIVGKVLGLW